MITRAAIQHLRLKFSVLLMPVFWWSLWVLIVQFDPIHNFDHLIGYAILFIAIHLFIYPASNAYNGYQDQDKGSIGDIENPLKADKEVFWISVVFDFLGLGLVYFVLPSFLSIFYCEAFTFFLVVYVVVSRLYSWRRIRLKKYAILGFLAVFIFQGAWIVQMMVWPYHIINSTNSFEYFNHVALAASFLFGGGYPITQIYQHEQDRNDGVKTISMLLGIKGTIIFSGLMNAIGMALLFFALWKMNHTYLIAVYLLCMIPTLYQFSKWSQAVFKDETQANYKNVMKMTWISAICNNIAFILFILLTLLLN